MQSPTQPRIRLVIVACLLGVPMISMSAHADDHGPSTIETALLHDFDVSKDIEPVDHPAKLLTLKPRSIPGYEELQSAFWSGGPNAPAALLANGADPNAPNEDGEPILHYAVWLNQYEKLEDLLRAGADPNLPDKDGETPLGRAIWGGHERTVALLLDYGADPLRKRKDGITELAYARQLGKDKLVALMEADRPPPIEAKPIQPPTVLRQPDQVFGSNRFRAAGGGQALVYSADSQQLIAGDEGGGIRFFDAKTGELQHVINAHDGAVLGLALIPGSNILVSSGYDRTTRFWLMDTSSEIRRLRLGSHGLAVSPDGRLLFTGYHIWEIESVEPLKLAPRGRLLNDPNPNVGSRWSFFTPDSRYLVIGREPVGIWVWDLAKDQLHRIKEFSPVATKSITWEDLAQAVDIGTAEPADRLALGWDQYTVVAAEPEVLEAFADTVASITDSTRAMACSSDGQYLATLGYDSRIDVYDVENNRHPYEHAGHTAAVLAVSASPDGTLIASGANDLTVHIWDRDTGEQLAVIPTNSFVYSVCFSPDSSLLAIGDNDANLYLWDVKDESLERYPTPGRITDLAFDAKGEVLVSLGFEVHVLDIKTRTTRATISAGNAGQGTLAVSPEGLIVAGDRAMAANETFKVPHAWMLDEDTLTEKRDLFTEAMGHRSFIDAVAFSSDGKLLAVSSQEAIRLWDMNRQQPVGGKMCGHTYSIGDLKFSPDGKWLASASWDGTARVWEVRSGRQVLVLDADIDRVSCVDFTSDGHLLTANWDGTVHSWDLPRLLAAPGGR